MLRGIDRGHNGYGLASVQVYSKRDSLTQKACKLTRLKNVGKSAAQSGKMTVQVTLRDCISSEPLLSKLSPRLTCLFLFLDSSLIHMHNFSCFLMPGSLEERHLKRFPQLRQV